MQCQDKIDGGVFAKKRDKVGRSIISRTVQTHTPLIQKECIEQMYIVPVLKSNQPSQRHCVTGCVPPL